MHYFPFYAQKFLSREIFYPRYYSLMEMFDMKCLFNYFYCWNIQIWNIPAWNFHLNFLIFSLFDFQNFIFWNFDFWIFSFQFFTSGISTFESLISAVLIFESGMSMFRGAEPLAQTKNGQCLVGGNNIWLSYKIMHLCKNILDFVGGLFWPKRMLFWTRLNIKWVDSQVPTIILV